MFPRGCQKLNMPVGVTELSRRIHALHMLILWVCVIIAVAVFGVMIYSIVKFRRSQGAVDRPKAKPVLCGDAEGQALRRVRRGLLPRGRFTGLSLRSGRPRTPRHLC